MVTGDVEEGVRGALNGTHSWPSLTQYKSLGLLIKAGPTTDSLFDSASLLRSIEEDEEIEQEPTLAALVTETPELRLVL